MKKRIISLLLLIVVVVGALVSCGAANIEGKNYKVSKVEISFNKDASTKERYLLLDAVRTLSDNEKMTEKKALKWMENFVGDLSKNYTAEFSDGKVTENFFEMSTTMVKETDETKKAEKLEALNVLAEELFNMTIYKTDADGNVTGSNYEVALTGDGLTVKRTGTEESRYVVSSYARYIQLGTDSTHSSNNSDGFMAQAFQKDETIMYSSGKIKQTIEKDGFVIEITYKKK